ncbi:MAG TPA: xylan 1,4-beta-xylosidase, partial [Actinomycetota bacterium]|nr:xylan 1,4-beta-xylosidase [Actinomycetota bacterium]
AEKEFTWTGPRDGRFAAAPAVTDAPAGLTARPGRAQVTLDWQAVPGAIGSLVHRADDPAGPFLPLDHHGGDTVFAVPHPPYVDTQVEPGRARWYAVAAVPDADTIGPLSEPVAAAPEAAGEADVAVRVDAARPTGPLHRPWRPMIGSEHLSHMLSPDHTGGRVIGEELTEALRIVHDELGVAAVRAHGILDDDLGTYREVDGRPVHDFTGIDRVYDRLLSLGLRPVVELAYMPRALARDPDHTVFYYKGVSSPPKDWDRWEGLVRDLAQHLVDRYGRDEVRDHWAFEVWNEPNLEYFWSGDNADYLRLYDTAARAVRSVDPALRVGGPATAAVGWVEDLVAHTQKTGVPLDFVSTHLYGGPPLDLRPALARHGRQDAAIWWTEWGTHPRLSNPVAESVYAAASLAKGMRSAAGRVDALSWWVASDHFEELGRPKALLHGGFGLLTVGNLRKPRFWALALLERLGPEELAVELDGDGAGGLVEAWGSRDPGSGRVAVALWNVTLDQTKSTGAPQLDRQVTLRVQGLPERAWNLRHFRVDLERSNIAAVWERMSGGAAWPDEDQWANLRKTNRLEELEPARRVRSEGGVIELALDLPMPSLSLVELAPETRPVVGQVT